MPPPVGRLAGDRLPVPGQRRPHAGPAAASVRVGLIEDRDSAAPDANEVIDQSRRLLAVGGAQVEGELPVRRLTLRLGAREGEEDVHLLVLELLQQRQDAGDGRRADVAEQQEDLVLQHQLERVFHARIGLIAVVVELWDDPAGR